MASKKTAVKKTAPKTKTAKAKAEKVTTVPPTRDVRERVVTEYSPSKVSMFWHDKKARVHLEWHATVRGSKLTTVEGTCGEPLTQTVRDFGSAASAKEAYKAEELAKTAAWYQTAIGTSTDFFFVGPKKKVAAKGAAGAKGAAAKVDATPVPAKIAGYASDGRMIADLAKLLPDAKKLGKALPAGNVASLTKAAKPLAKDTQKALLGLADAAKKGKLRELSWNFTLGFRLALAFDPEELAEVLGNDKKALALAMDAIEVFHDGGLAHYVVCKDGVRVYNNEGSLEPVITKSLDAFVWALVHRTAVKAGTYDAKAYAAALKKLAIKRELPLLNR